MRREWGARREACWGIGYSPEAAMLDDDHLRDLLTRYRRVAVVGLSRNPLRPSFGVADYLQRHGYRILPVNPLPREILGETVYPRLEEVPAPVEIVDVFRRPEFIPDIVTSAIACHAAVLWLQEGLRHPEAEARARAAGLQVVADRCLLKEHRRLCNA